MVKYKLEDSFGPIGSLAGKVAFFGVLIMMFAYDSYIVVSILFLLITTFIGFSKTFIFIDTEKNRIRFSTMIFGLFPTGKFMDIDDDMEIGIAPNMGNWQYVSRANRSLSLRQKAYKIVLYKLDNKPLFTLKYISTKEEAEKELDRFALLLDME